MNEENYGRVFEPNVCCMINLSVDLKNTLKLNGEARE